MHPARGGDDRLRGNHRADRRAATPSAAWRRSPSRRRSAKKKYSINPGKTKKVKVKLTRKAKKAVARKGKLKVKAKVRNSENGAKRTFKLKLKG